MQFTKPMIELVYEIRRQVPPSLKPGVKLANPDLFLELIEHYHDKATTIARALIKELLNLAGDPWPTELARPATEAAPRQVVKIYRGTTALKAAPTVTDEQNQPRRSKMVYRGRTLE